MDKPDREAVKTLAIAIGVREAARQLSLPESTVKSWSTRGKWFKQPDLPPTVSKPNNASTASITPSEALEHVLKQNSGKIKLNLSKAAVAASTRLETMSGDQVLEHSRPMKDIAGTASIVHGWEERQGQHGSLQVNILANQAAVQIQDLDTQP